MQVAVTTAADTRTSMQVLLLLLLLLFVTVSAATPPDLLLHRLAWQSNSMQRYAVASAVRSHRSRYDTPLSGKSLAATSLTT
jgi:hypothetical protein